MSGIVLDSEHGVNPGMMNCYFCNEPKGVILHGRIQYKSAKALRDAGIDVPADGSAPRNLIIDKEPCDKCQDFMKQGVVLISVKEEGLKNDEEPFRTGGWVVVSEDFITRIICEGDTRDSILRKRVAFVPDRAWEALGLPRGTLTSEST